MKIRSDASALALLGLAGGLLIGCGEGGSRWAGTMTDSAGIQIVQNPATGVWGPDETAEVVEELKIGRADGDPNYQFGAIAGVEAGSDGSIYVLDQQATAVRVYDANGQFLRSMGRAGSGPGELSLVVTGLIVRNDTIIVADMGQQRLTQYQSDGTPIGSFPILIAEGLPMRWSVGPQGVIQQSRIGMMPTGAGAGGTDPKDLLLVRNAAGTLMDTLLTMPVGQTFSASQNSMAIRLFEPEPIWEVGQDGSLWFGMNSEYSVNGYSSTGELQRIVRREGERKPVTDTDKAAFIEMLKALFQQQGVPPQAVDQVLQGVSFADHYPTYARILVGPESTLWLQQVVTAEDAKAAGGEFNIQDTGSARWDVYNAEGHYLGVVTLPQRFQPTRVAGDKMYGVWRDELDVQHAMRIRVTLPSVD